MHIIVFTTERFDYTNPIPEEYNAGNMFDGADAAAFLKQGLEPVFPRVEAFDEDWGWLVTDHASASLRFDLAVYNGMEMERDDEDELKRRKGCNEWTILIGCFEPRKTLGFIPGKKEIDVDDRLLGPLWKLLTAPDITIVKDETYIE